MSHTSEITSVPFKDEKALQQATDELVKQGLKLELLKNAVPRMFYPDQLQKHLGRNSEVCDYVLRIKDSRYDLAFIKQEDGTLRPVFDNWAGEVKKVLGVPWDGKVEHWAGLKKESIEMLHSVGKFSQAYSKHAAMNAARKKGYRITSCTSTVDGRVQIRVGVK